MAAPRGFCAGVERAVRIVERLLELYGPPIYVRHEIVHNRFVVDGLRRRGAVFVNELSECPPDRPVVASAHGVAQSVVDDAETRRLHFVDATCPLVKKVHIEVRRHHARGREVVLIGHVGHPETIGTMGQLPEGAVKLVETVEDVAGLEPRDPGMLAYATQTTLSRDDAAEVIDALKARFPGISGPHGEDICYASTNRQEAVKAIASEVDALFVIGASNSSNSQRLVSTARRAGCPVAELIERADDMPWELVHGARAVGLTAGASAPEELVDEVLDAFRARFDLLVSEHRTSVENLTFRLPNAVRDRVA